MRSACCARAGPPRRGPCSAPAWLNASDFVWLYLLRGFAQEELQAWSAADSDFQKASQLPLDDNARYVLFVNRGVLRVRQERFDDAVADLKAAIERKPKAYQAYRQPGPGLPAAGQAGPGPRTVESRRPARAGAGPPLSPASPALPGTQRADPGPRRLRPGDRAREARTARTRSTTTSSVAGCCSRAGSTPKRSARSTRPCAARQRPFAGAAPAGGGLVPAGPFRGSHRGV